MTDEEEVKKDAEFVLKCHYGDIEKAKEAVCKSITKYKDAYKYDQNPRLKQRAEQLNEVLKYLNEKQNETNNF